MHTTGVVDIRRREVRMQFLRPIYVRPIQGPGELRRLFASNLSSGGMFIRTPKPVDAGTELEILIESHGRAVAFAKAVVAHALPFESLGEKRALPGFGVRFTELAPRAAQQLATMQLFVTAARAGNDLDALGRVLLPGVARADTVKTAHLPLRSPRRAGSRRSVVLRIALAVGLGVVTMRLIQTEARSLATSRNFTQSPSPSPAR